MNEEAAFVDSFFLPGGILDPEDEEDVHPPDEPLRWDGGPPENPWANENKQEKDWNAAEQQPQPTFTGILSPILGGNGMDGRVESQPRSAEYNGLVGGTVLVGNSSYELTPRLALGPLHESPLMMRDPVMTRGDASALFAPLATREQHAHAYPRIKSNMPPLETTEPSCIYFIRPPPGFTPTNRAAIDDAVMTDQRDGHDSIQSDSSVPLELYDRESLSASSLSGSSSMDESLSLTQNNSSILLDETPNASSLLNDSIDLDLLQSKYEAVSFKRIYENTQGDSENENLAKLSEAESSPSPAQSNPDAQLNAASPRLLNKPRNRRGGKAKRQKTNTTAAQTHAALCVTTQQVYRETLRASSMDWIANKTVILLPCLQTAIHTGDHTILTLCRRAVTVWMSLFLICKRILFTVIRLAGILLSVALLISRKAILESIQQPRVALDFAIMYWFPHCMSQVMQFVVLPHWTPHLVSCIVMYGLSRQPDNNHGEIDTFRDCPDAQTDGNIGNTDNSHQAATTTTIKDDKTNQACERNVSRIILRQLRWNLPVLFCLEGFSYELGTPMGLHGPARLVTAYLIILLRLNLLHSPVAWLCGALQVLMASYLHWMPLLDLYMVAVGLSSIRFIKFLQFCKQAATDDRATNKDR